MQNSVSYDAIAQQLLQNYWGYESFQPLQRQIIQAVFQGEDALALMPTGGGKSLCYQLPALAFEGICLVVSPLLALMKDQVLQLKSLGISAELLSSELDSIKIDEVFMQCKEGLIKILYVSPERLKNEVFLFNIQDVALSFIAIDEAHCISEWGQDFRPSYQNIAQFRTLYPYLPCLALTATATPKVVDEICTKLQLKSPKIFKTSFQRENLSLEVMDVQDKFSKIASLLQRYNGSGLIYTRTRKDTEDLDAYLKKQGITRSDFYHAGLDTHTKNRKQKEWLASQENVLISTNAFGMGIDKSDVSFIIHLSTPPSLENYYQEIGRAGRDGNEAETFIFWNEQELSHIDALLEKQFPSQSEFNRVTRALYSVFQIADHQLLQKTFELSFESIAKLSKVSVFKIKAVVAFLHNQEIVYLNKDKSPSKIELLIAPDDLQFLDGRSAYFVELLLRNLPGVAQQKVFFDERQLCQKLNMAHTEFQKECKYLHKTEIIEYIDGNAMNINFLMERNQQRMDTKWWRLFNSIQKNKIKKWVEMKYYLTDAKHCKKYLILSYFGETGAARFCGNCSVCRRKQVQERDLPNKILAILSHAPATLQELSTKLVYHTPHEIQDALMHLRDNLGEVRNIDFRTYALATP